MIIVLHSKVKEVLSSFYPADDMEEHKTSLSSFSIEAILHRTAGHRPLGPIHYQPLTSPVYAVDNDDDISDSDIDVTEDSMSDDVDVESGLDPHERTSPPTPDSYNGTENYEDQAKYRIGDIQENTAGMK